MVLFVMLVATLVSHLLYEISKEKVFLALTLVGMAIITCCAEVLL